MLIIGGATATGKSSIAVTLAKLTNGEIVSADSMQIYRHMDIGTAKINEKEKGGIVHHMIDIVEPTQEFSVAEYQNRAVPIIKDIKSRGKLPIIVGGTGLYISSLIYPLQFANTYRDETLRKELLKQSKLFGNEYLYSKLLEIDPESAVNIHPNNVRRIIRAIEVKTLSGNSVADTQDKSQHQSNHYIYAVSTDRVRLYNAINKRVEEMFVNGLFQEVDALLNKHGVKFSNQSMQGIGYKEFNNYYRGYSTLKEVKELIKKNTRRYAKRQFTWFRRYDNCIWIDYYYETSHIELCNKILDDYNKKKGNLEQ